MENSLYPYLIFLRANFIQLMHLHDIFINNTFHTYTYIYAIATATATIGAAMALARPSLFLLPPRRERGTNE